MVPSLRKAIRRSIFEPSRRPSSPQFRMLTMLRQVQAPLRRSWRRASLLSLLLVLEAPRPLLRHLQPRTLTRRVLCRAASFTRGFHMRVQWLRTRQKQRWHLLQLLQCL